jgi:hypothetical protein
MEEKNEEKRDVFKDQSRVIKQLNKDRKIERFRSKRKSERSVRDINLIRENQPIRIFLSGNYVVSNFQPSNLQLQRLELSTSFPFCHGLGQIYSSSYTLTSSILLRHE